MRTFLILLTALLFLSCAPKSSTITLQSIQLDQNPITLATNTQTTLEVFGIYSDGSKKPLSPANLRFSSEDSAIATVDANATLFANAEGNTTLSIETTQQFPNGTALMSALFSIQVKKGTPQSLSITPPITSLAIGEEQTLTVTVNFAEGFSQDITQSALYSSSDSTIATINSQAVIRALKEGNCSITTTFSSLSQTDTLTVTPAVLQTLELTPANSSVKSGDTITFSTQATYSDATTDDVTLRASYSSSDESIVTIDNMAKATALSQGSATITARFETTSSSATVAVDEEPHLELFLKNSDATQTQQMFPYLCDTTAACTKSLILAPQGGIITLATFTLKAVGADFEIKNVQALSAQNIGSPQFFNLPENTIIKAGSEREFQLQATQTLSAIVDLRFSFTTDLNLNSQFIETYKFQTTANPNN